jgi:hypothetical protein
MEAKIHRGLVFSALASRNGGSPPQQTSLELRSIRSLLVIFFFVSYTMLYLELFSVLLARSAELRQLSERFIPALRNFVPGFSYTGFILPLIVATFALFLVVRDSRPTSREIIRQLLANKAWLVAFILSVAGWYFTPGFASGGHTDFPFAIFSSFFIGWKWKSANLRQSILCSVVIGFGIGLVSDLQSQTFFVGIFGGWGLLDGDLLGTLLLPLAALTAAVVMKRLSPHSTAKQHYQLSSATVGK